MNPVIRSIASQFLLTLRAALGLVVIATLLGGLTLIHRGTFSQPLPPLSFALAKSTQNQNPVTVPSAIR
jgi:hypothetical protein